MNAMTDVNKAFTAVLKWICLSLQFFGPQFKNKYDTIQGLLSRVMTGSVSDAAKMNILQDLQVELRDGMVLMCIIKLFGDSHNFLFDPKFMFQFPANHQEMVQNVNVINEMMFKNGVPVYL